MHDGFPPTWNDSYEKVLDLRYGENPHQAGAFYARAGSPTHLLDGVRQLHGKELSFNNLLDLSSARELVEEFEQPACAILKHNNPCGCGVAESCQAAYERAFACDPESAYGGVIAVNRRIDAAFARRLNEQFIEVLLAPGFDDDALAVLTEKKNVRLLELAHWPAPAHEVEGKPVIGGQLVQTRDVVSETREQMRVMTTRQPSEREWQAMLFAWRVCRHVRSNAIVLAVAGEDGACATVGIGAGQMSRVDAVRIAVEKAHATQPQLLAGCALASDAFFPFRRRARSRHRRRRQSRHPARRIGARRGRRAGRRAGRRRDGRDRRPPLPPLAPAGRRRCAERRPRSLAYRSRETLAPLASPFRPARHAPCVLAPLGRRPAGRVCVRGDLKSPK